MVGALVFESIDPGSSPILGICFIISAKSMSTLERLCEIRAQGSESWLMLTPVGAPLFLVGWTMVDAKKIRDQGVPTNLHSFCGINQTRLTHISTKIFSFSDKKVSLKVKTIWPKYKNINES
jgi:hypothetical protein